MLIKLGKIRNCLYGIFNSTLKRNVDPPSTLTSETNRNIFLFGFISFFFFFGVCIYVCTRKSNFKQEIFIRVHQKICHEIADYILTNEKHFPKTLNQWKFGYGLFTKLPRIIVVSDFSLSSFKLKRGAIPPLAK